MKAWFVGFKLDTWSFKRRVVYGIIVATVSLLFYSAYSYFGYSEEVWKRGVWFVLFSVNMYSAYLMAFTAPSKKMRLLECSLLFIMGISLLYADTINWRISGVSALVLMWIVIIVNLLANKWYNSKIRH